MDTDIRHLTNDIYYNVISTKTELEIKLIQGKAPGNHSLHGEIAAFVLLKLRQHLSG